MNFSNLSVFRPNTTWLYNHHPAAETPTCNPCTSSIQRMRKSQNRTWLGRLVSILGHVSPSMKSNNLTIGTSPPGPISEWQSKVGLGAEAMTTPQFMVPETRRSRTNPRKCDTPFLILLAQISLGARQDGPN